MHGLGAATGQNRVRFMNAFVHQRHKSLTPLREPRELVVICAPLRSNVNLSRIVRAASCCGVQKVVACGQSKIDRRIARDAADQIDVQSRRSLDPVLKQYRSQGYQLVGLEQTSNSTSLFEFQFVRKTALVVGNERLGLSSDALGLIESVVEIPVYGLPHSHNVATACCMALYEFCRQFPCG